MGSIDFLSKSLNNPLIMIEQFSSPSLLGKHAANSPRNAMRSFSRFLTLFFLMPAFFSRVLFQATGVWSIMVCSFRAIVVLSGVSFSVSSPSYVPMLTLAILFQPFWEKEQNRDLHSISWHYRVVTFRWFWRSFCNHSKSIFCLLFDIL